MYYVYYDTDIEAVIILRPWIIVDDLKSAYRYCSIQCRIRFGIKW